MRAFLAALAAVVVVFVGLHLLVGGLRDELSTAVAGSVPGAVRLDPQLLPPVSGELVTRPPAVLPAAAPAAAPPPSVRLDPRDVAVRGAVPTAAAHE